MGGVEAERIEEALAWAEKPRRSPSITGDYASILAAALRKRDDEIERLRDLLDEALRRGHFDPFFPFDTMRRFAGTKRVKRDYESQKAWEADMAALAPADEAKP